MSVLGISERLITTNSYKKDKDERKVYLHLYNTFENERKITYERYYTSSTQRNLLVQKEYIYSDRKVVISGYSINKDERKLVKPNSYVKHTDDRKITYERWFTTSNERTITLNYVLHAKSERNLITKGSYITERKVFFKHWIGSERTIYTFGRKKEPIRDVRKCFIQTEKHLSTIRKIYLPITSIKFNLRINVVKNNLNGKIFKVSDKYTINPFQGSTHNGHLKVIDEKINQKIFFINDKQIKGNLNLIYYNNIFENWIVKDLTFSTFGMYNLTQLNETTWLLKFYLVPTKDNLILRISPPLLNVNPSKEYNEEVIKWLNYQMNRYSIINFKVNKKEYDFYKTLVFENVAYELIEFEFYFTKMFFDLYYKTFKDYITTKNKNPNTVYVKLMYNFIDHVVNYDTQKLLYEYLLIIKK
jgi:hypothetical protein